MSTVKLSYLLLGVVVLLLVIAVPFTLSWFIALIDTEYKVQEYKFPIVMFVSVVSKVEFLGIMVTW